MTRKILFLSLYVSFLSSIGFSQTNPIPNAGFETWSGTPETPDGWGIISIPGFPPLIPNLVSATKATDSNGGSAAILLESTTFLIPGITLLGAASTGTLSPLNYSASGGIPFNELPLVLKGYYKYLPGGTDTASISVLFTKWNSTTNKRDTVGGGKKFFRNSVSAYTLFQIPLQIDAFIVPDSAIITMLSGSPANPVVGSKLFVDDLLFYPAGGISSGINMNVPSGDALTVYPNPASTSISVDLGNYPGARQITLYDILGNEISSIPVQNHFMQINLSGFQSGLYLCRILDTKNSVLFSNKFSVIK